MTKDTTPPPRVDEGRLGDVLAGYKGQNILFFAHGLVHRVHVLQKSNRAIALCYGVLERGDPIFVSHCASPLQLLRQDLPSGESNIHSGLGFVIQATISTVLLRFLRQSVRQSECRAWEDREDSTWEQIDRSGPRPVPVAIYPERRARLRVAELRLCFQFAQ